MKYLGINLIKYIYNLCAENYKTRIKEFKELRKCMQGLENIYTDSKTQHSKSINIPQGDSYVRQFLSKLLIDIDFW